MIGRGRCARYTQGLPLRKRCGYSPRLFRQGSSTTERLVRENLFSTFWLLFSLIWTRSLLPGLVCAEPAR